MTKSTQIDLLPETVLLSHIVVTADIRNLNKITSSISDGPNELYSLTANSNKIKKTFQNDLATYQLKDK